MGDPIKIFTQPPVANEQLKNLNPLLSFHWRGLDSTAITMGEYNPASPLKIVADAREANVVVLPMIWSYYLWNDRRSMTEATRLAELAATYQKQIVVWHKGDLVPIIPFQHALVFLPGIVQRIRKSNQRACPVFVKDPARVCGYVEPLYRNKAKLPKVGFCGYASVSVPKLLWSILKGAQLRVLSKVGRYGYEGVPIIPATLLRARALKFISIHPMIEAEFVIRGKYTPALSPNLSASQAREDAERVFYSNIHGTDYTLCVRGYGNWSYRFYETLACGRIPVLVDTDCVLPSVPNVDLKEYYLSVDRSEVRYIGEKIADFHSSLSPTRFVELQKGCRELWEKHFTLDGFMADATGYLSFH